MNDDAAFSALGDEQFVSLGTFRKSGELVSTPVWIARDGDGLVVTTTATTGKVKRLGNDPRVRMAACSRRGTVKDGAATVSGVAEVLRDQPGVTRGGSVIGAKYGVQYRLLMVVERLFARRSTRVIIRILPA